ncbi:MAG: CRTAC1 family protein [Geminicoccaceae bacterium]|nr:CRTAC1 family protein [Geminicoccaceae bacterium]
MLAVTALGALAVAAALVGTGVWWRHTTLLLEPGPHYVREQVAETYFLDDMGVADLDADGTPDLFTTNHSALQLIRSGATDAPLGSALGLDQTSAYAGEAATADLVPLDRPGLSIQMYRTAIVLTNEVQGEVGLGSGQVRFDWPATVVAGGGFTVRRASSEQWRTVIDFTANAEGELYIEPQPAPTDGFPIEIALGADLPSADVFVGPDHVPARDDLVRLTPRDRHGMAMADVDGDGADELFISRGGVRGNAVRFADIQDELYRRVADRFEPVADNAGIDKAGCPGRQVAWVDVDGDGLLDLYQACGRIGGSIGGGANRLYHQVEPGRFVESAAAAGLADLDYGAFLWLDLDGDADQDMVLAGYDRHVLYRNTGVAEGETGPPRFLREEIGAAPAGPASRLRKLAAGDIDADGDLDVLVASRDGNVLLRNDAGRLSIEATAPPGLPASSHTVSLVDVDNDGRLDVASLPDGIYRQTAAGGFEATGDLRARVPLLANDARMSWFDRDGDGTLDVIAGVRPCWPGRICAAEEEGLAMVRRWMAEPLGIRPPAEAFASRRWLVEWYRGVPRKGHWLGIDIVGPPGNAQSIGAVVHVVGRQSVRATQVGQLEGAHFSQGNYRIHVGLGDESDLEALEVRWPDGRTVRLDDPPVDRLIEVRHPGAASNGPAPARSAAVAR